MAIEFEPYVGPRPFERGEEALFFGRDREASEVLSLVIAHRMLLLYAPSGAGKTSLLNAKLIPLLEGEEFEVLPLVRVQGLIPEDIQPEEIPNLYVFNTLMSWAEEEANPKRLAQMSLADSLKEREHPTDEEGLPSPRIVIFDQFEELFTFYQERWQDREGFFEQVRDALEGDPLLRVVFVLREDYLAQLDPYAPLLPEKLRTRFRLERLREGAALAAVTSPLKDTERSFAEGVAEQLVEELLKVRIQAPTGESAEVPGEFVEPVQLQVVCQSLWRDLPSDVTEITQDHLQAFGDVNQALSRFYERSIKRAAQETGIKEGDLRAWFEDILITPAGTCGTAYRGREKTGGIPNAVVDALEDLHLIRGERRAGAQWHELTHDRFIGSIQRSNEAWRAARRGRWLRIGGSVAAVLILLLVVVAALLRTEAMQADQQSQATAAAAAAAVSEAKTTATAEATASEYVRQGFVYAEQGDYKKAIANYTYVTVLYPDYVPAYFNRGFAYRDLGDYEQAIADFTKAVELDPHDAPAYFNRGSAYADLGNYEQAIADYDQAIKLDPDYAKAYNNRGLAYRKLGDYEQAIADFTKAVELDPHEAKPYNNRGLAYADLGNYERAITDYNQAIELDPDYALAYNNRGNAYRDLGDYHHAFADYTKAGNAYHNLGEYEQALDYYQQTLAIAQELGDRLVEALRSSDTRLDFTKILPKAKRPQNVQLLDADGDGKDEWIVFYKFDLVEGAPGRKFSGAAVYNDDHGDPPVVFPYELHPPDVAYLGEQHCVAEVRDLIPTNEGLDLLVSCFTEEGLVVYLSVFHWYDYDKDDLSKNPSEERQGYECLGFFYGSGGITLAESKVIVKKRTEERSQLSIKRVYDVIGGGYFQPGGKELWPPVEKSVEFTFGVSEDVAQSPYPEEVVMAFYLALGQNNSLAQTYLSEASGLRNLVGSSNFGTAAEGDRIQRVLVKRIIYTPDKEKEERHEPVQVTVSVASVTSEGEDPPRDVTWEVVWEVPRGGDVAKPGWKLHRMITR